MNKNSWRVSCALRSLRYARLFHASLDRGWVLAARKFSVYSKANMQAAESVQK